MAAFTALNSELRTTRGFREAFNDPATALLISAIAGIAFILRGYVACPRFFASTALGASLVGVFVLVSS